MKIGVCFKIVPDYEGLMPEEWRDPESLDFTYVKKMYGCFDEAALEMALRIADGCKAAGTVAETVAVTCGAPSGAVSDGLLRALFAAGFDDVALLPATEEFTPAETARLLASYFVKNPADLILTGRMVGPNDSGMTPFYLAKELDCPLFTELTAARYDGSARRIEITCKGAESLKVYGLMGSAVATVGDAEAAYLRLFPLKARMDAKKRLFSRWSPEDGVADPVSDEAAACCPTCGSKSIAEGDTGGCVEMNSAMSEAVCDKVLLRHVTEETSDVSRIIPVTSAEDTADLLIRILKGEDPPFFAEEENAYQSADTAADGSAAELTFAATGCANAVPAEATAPDSPADIMLFRGGQQEKELAMRFAAAKDLPCHTDVFSFREENGIQYSVRHVYSTHLEGCFPAEGSVCILSATAPEALQESAKNTEQMQYSNPASAGTPEQMQLSVSEDLLQPSDLNATLLREIPLEQKEDISAAKLVLLGGKGLGKKENFKRLEALAAKLDAVCGCTRPVAMAGWASYDKVVGLSGSILQADVCIAFGVSGAAPLMQGAGGAKRLIAVNNDPKAPIFSRCSDGLVADCLEILEAMETRS